MRKVTLWNRQENRKMTVNENELDNYDRRLWEVLTTKTVRIKGKKKEIIIRN